MQGAAQRSLWEPKPKEQEGAGLGSSVLCPCCTSAPCCDPDAAASQSPSPLVGQHCAHHPGNPDHGAQTSGLGEFCTAGNPNQAQTHSQSCLLHRGGMGTRLPNTPPPRAPTCSFNYNMRLLLHEFWGRKNPFQTLLAIHDVRPRSAPLGTGLSPPKPRSPFRSSKPG